MRANYHTHTARCRHAEGNDEAYVQAAMEAGFEVLGFSDHAPFPFANGYESRIRMTCAQLPDYTASINALRDRYAGQIKLHLGLECEYFPRYADHIRRMLDEDVTYLILGQHFPDSEEDTSASTVGGKTDDGVLRYAESAANAIRTGLFAYVAHPDLYMKYRTDDQFTPACEQAADMVCQAALEARIPLEFNLLGQLEGVGYPSQAFWEYARKWNNPVIFGIDAHDPAHFLAADNIERGQKRVAVLGYTILDHLPMDD